MTASELRRLLEVIKPKMDAGDLDAAAVWLLGILPVEVGGTPLDPLSTADAVREGCGKICVRLDLILEAMARESPTLACPGCNGPMLRSGATDWECPSCNADDVLREAIDDHMRKGADEWWDKETERLRGSEKGEGDA